VSDLAALQQRLGYKFRDENLLRLALTHPSIGHESGKEIEDNQRLEFLGDAVLGMVLTHKLYEQFPGSEEGPLTQARAQLVNHKTLAERAQALDLGAYLILGRGEELQGGRERPSSLADAFEALLGAIFLDGGFDVARDFILREFNSAFGVLNALPFIDNPKGQLQELLQAHSPQAPEYRTVSVSGPDHDRAFEVVVAHGGKELARGSGKSKKAAESDAALAALKKLQPD
jgi:ribonuclease-3